MVLCHRGNIIWIHSTGDIKKTAACRVKPYELSPQKEAAEESDDQSGSEPEVSEQVKMDGTLVHVKKDVVGAEYSNIERNMCFLENAVFVVEVLVLEHCRPEVREAKEEMQNLEDYEIQGC